MPWVPGLTARVLTHEGARAGRQPVVDALLALVRREGLAGITVTRALEGYSQHGTMRSSNVLELGDDLPLVVEIVDRADRMEPLLPEIAALVISGTLTVTDARVYFPASSLFVRDVMVPARAVAHTETPLAQVLALLLENGVRLVPVLSGDNTLLGIITLGHLLREMDPALATHLGEMRSPEDVRSHLERLVDGRTASESMLAQPHVLQPDVLLEAAVRFLTRHGVTRVPVVNTSRRLVGLLVEHELVAALVAPLTRAADSDLGATLRGSVHPAAGALLTAGALADRDVPHVPPAAPQDAVVTAVESAASHLALVVDADGRLQGVVDEHTLLRHTVPGTPATGGTVLSRFFARALGGGGAPRAAGDTQQTASSLMIAPPPTVDEDLPVVDALARMIDADHHDSVIVTALDRRPVGILWRHVALRALVGG